MPSKKNKVSSLHIIVKFFFFLCAAILLTFLALSKSKSSNTNNPVSLGIKESPTRTPPPSRSPQEFAGLEIDPTNIAVGDKYQNLILREIKSLSGDVKNRLDLEITFQGEIPLSATLVKNVHSQEYPQENLICTSPKRNIYTNIPILSKSNSLVSICIINSKEVEKYVNNPDPINFKIDNLTIHTSPDAPYTYTATFIGLIK